jgi:cell division protein FtsB
MFNKAGREKPFFNRVSDRAKGSRKSFRLFLWLAGSVVLLYLFATGNFGFLRIISLYEKRESLIRENRYLLAVNADLEWKKRELARNPAMVEKLAREKFSMIKKGEILYKIIPPKDSISKLKEGFIPRGSEGAGAPLQN